MRSNMRVNSLKHLHDGVVPINQGSFPLKNYNVFKTFNCVLNLYIYIFSFLHLYYMYNEKNMCNEYICKNSGY